MRYRMDMSYDGAPFCGWQIQPSAPSVQEEVERCLETLLREPVRVTGAGRTDTGVSATRYVAHFDYESPLPEQLAYKLNALLPKAVSVKSITPAGEDFHARFGATLRQYTYYLHRKKDPFLARASYHYGYPDVDFEAMNRAAGQLLGTHDFSCFEKSGGDNKTSVCTVFRALWEPYTPALCTDADGCWRFVIEADRFLRNMVRAIVGTLLEVGRGRRTETDFQALILPVSDTPAASSRRGDAGESVSGHALFLTDIRY